MRLHWNKNPIISAALTMVIAVITAPISAQQTELMVYTAIEEEDMERYAQAFHAEHKGIKIRWLRDSTGVITARLLAEKNNPKADVVFGLAATSLMVMKSKGMFHAYRPKGVENLEPRFVDEDDPPSWVGMDAWVAAICYNTVAGEEKGVPAPQRWRDLAKPVYKGHIAMPNPRSSGTGFLAVTSWLQIYSEGGGWHFMDGLHKNIARYTHSGSKPCEQAAKGQIPIGISFLYRAAKFKSEGAPIKIVLPEEGIGWDMEASAIIEGTKKLAAAKALMNWIVTKRANILFNESYAVVAHAGIAKPINNYLPKVLDMMIYNDFEWAATNRQHILREWQTRYGSLSP